MTLAARILVARAQATSRKAARKRRAELERELAGYATGADRCDFEAMLDRYPDVLPTSCDPSTRTST